VRRADLIRSIQAPFRIEPDCGQIPKYGVDSSNSERCDVLHERDRWSNLANDPVKLTPQAAALAVEAGTFAGDADVLARPAASDKIHDSTPASAVEGGNVTPDRSWIQPFFAYTRRQNRSGIGFPLHVTDDARRWYNSVDRSLESSGSGEQTDDIDGTSNHIDHRLQSGTGRAVRSRFKYLTGGRATIGDLSTMTPAELRAHNAVLRRARHGAHAAAAAPTGAC
jgi:hypothetical protein